MDASNQPKSFADSFRILHDSDTDMGTVMLRKRWSMALERDVFEMIMEGELMMSSAVAVSECALAERALALLSNQELKVLIGGLGFGFTAQTALADPRVRELTVMERLAPVMEWHRAGILPWSEEFHSDPRLELVRGDFFAFLARDPVSRYDAVLIDIDDSPDRLWHASHATFYESTGLAAIPKHLLPGGVFALWCATPPSETFLEKVEATFATTDLVPVHFENPSLRQPETNYILLARTPNQGRQFAT